MRRSSGMTLIELIVCISIACILSCMCIPFTGLVEKSCLEAATNELLSNLRLAQQRAISEGIEIAVSFDTKNNSYSVYKKNIPSSVYVNMNLPGGIRFDNGRSTYNKTDLYTVILSFSSKGHPLPRACIISLCSSKGDYKSIAVGIATDCIYTK